jgi:hypothetical protein
MKTKTKKLRPPRHFPDAIDEILGGYGPRARVVQLWRQVDGTRDQWTYLGRFAPEQCQIELVAQRFGGGWYRGKIFGVWNRELRREEYFEQVSFGIDDRAWPVTAETLERIRDQHRN